MIRCESVPYQAFNGGAVRGPAIDEVVMFEQASCEKG